MWDAHSPSPSSDPDENLMLVEHMMFLEHTAFMTDDENCPPPFGETGEGIISPENSPAPSDFCDDCD